MAEDPLHQLLLQKCPKVNTTQIEAAENSTKLMRIKR